jgi:putative heme iron utilization protein
VTTDEGAVQDAGGFDPAETARALMNGARTAALATLDAAGAPFCSLVAFGLADGAPLVLVSALAAHTGNLARDPRGSLLLTMPGKGDPMAAPRLTLTGRFAPRAKEACRAAFLRGRPKSKLYVDLPDFRFLAIEVEAAHLNGGFGRAGRVEPGALLGST